MKRGVLKFKYLLLFLFLVVLIFIIFITASPSIIFVSPTLTNNSYTNNPWIFVNITSNENLNQSLLEWGNFSGFTNLSMSNSSLINWYKNVTSLEDYTYNYTIWAQNTSGNWNQSLRYFITVDTTAPDINFTIPTPTNASTQYTDGIYVNVSTNDTNEHSAFIDWNRSLIGWWAMDFYNSTGILDNSSHSNFATFYNGLDTENIVSGKYGKSLEFDGINDYIETKSNESLNITGNFSVFAWIKAQGTSSYNAIVGQYTYSVNSYGYLLYLQNGLLRATIYSGANGYGNVIGSHDLRDNKWHHVGLSFNGSKMKIYEDGVEINSADWNYPPEMLSNKVTIGLRKPSYADLPFNGSIDEVTIYRRALSPEEINASYTAETYKLYHNFTLLNDGVYDYTAYAIDAAGNVNSTTRQVTLDVPTSPNVVLNSPGNGTISGNETQIFNCSATDTNYNTELSNVTFYWNYSGSFVTNSTITLSGESASANFTRNNLTDKIIIWNCYACDNSSNCAFASNNYTLTIDTSVPTINITNVSISTTSAVINWTTNKNATSLVLYGTDSANLSLNSTTNGFSTIHTVTINNILPNAIYYYNVTSCDEGNHCNTSGTYNFTTLATKIYYIDATSGLDSNNGTSQSSAWKTISKINAENFNPGDSIMFKRNETWREQLTIPSSGSSGNPITFGDYGTGNKPIINPTEIVSNWSIYSGNIYMANVTSNVTQMFVDGIFYNLSFHPNVGFFNVTNDSGKYGLTDTNLTLTESQIVNSTVKVMTATWAIEERVASQYNDTLKTINWTSPTTYNVQYGYGYYLENKFWMLDSAGEWWYNSSSNKIYIWLHGDENPNNHSIEVSNQTWAVYAENKNNIYIANLTIKQTKSDSLYFNNVSYLKISNLNINDSGRMFIYVYNSKNITLENINAYKAREDGFILNRDENITITNNSLYNIGTVGKPVRSYAGVWLEWTNNSLFQYNSLYDMAYIGVRLEGRENILNKNIINKTCMTLDDCGAIHTQLSNRSVNTISNNILIDSMGSPPMKRAGSTNEAGGIYLDDYTGNFLIANNTIINSGRGIYLHNSFNNTVINNTIYDARLGAIYFREDTIVGITQNNNVSGNIFNVNTSVPSGTFIGLLGGSTNFGNFDYNYYSHPYFDNLAIYFYNGTTYYPTLIYFPLYLWKQEKGNETHSYDMNDFYQINDYKLEASNYGTEQIINNNFNGNINNWTQYPYTYERSWVSDCPIGEGGCLSAIHNDSESQTHLLTSNTFSLIKGQDYEIKFKIMGNTTFSVFPIVRRNAAPWDNLGYSNNRLILSSNKVKEVSKVFTATENATGRFDIEFNTNGTKFWIDNVYVAKVNNVQYNDKSNDFLFLYNTQTTLQIYNLSNNYLDLYGNVVSNSVTLQPYSSALLLAGFCNYDYVCNNRETYSSCPFDCILPSTVGSMSNFILNKDLIKVLIKQGESKRETIVIKNTGSNILNISLDLGELKKFMVASEESFILNPGKSKNIFIDIFAREEEAPDAYTGRIIFKDEKTGIKKTINVIIEVKEKKPLFDILVEVLSKKIIPGSDVTAKIGISNLGDLNNMDISVYSAVKNFEGEVLSFKKENIAIDKKLEIKRKLRIPQNISLGMYTFYSKVSYGDISASSTDTFEVVKEKPIEIYYYFAIWGGIFLIILLIIILFHKRKKRLKSKRKNLITSRTKKRKKKKFKHKKRTKRKLNSFLRAKQRKRKREKEEARKMVEEVRNLK